MLDGLITSKTRIKLLLKFFINPEYILSQEWKILASPEFYPAGTQFFTKAKFR